MIDTAFKEHVNDFFNMMYGGEITYCINNLVHCWDFQLPNLAIKVN